MTVLVAPAARMPSAVIFGPGVKTTTNVSLEPPTDSPKTTFSTLAEASGKPNS